MILKSLASLAAQMQVLENVHDSVVAMDLDGVIVSWNRGAERLHGYTSHEAIGRHVSFVRAAEQRGQASYLRLGPLLRAGADEFEATIVTKGGEHRQIHVRQSLIRDSGEQPIGVLSFAVDITELQAARAALSARERQLQTILDAMPQLIAHIDADSRYLFCNKAHEQFVGKSAKDLAGMSLEDAIPGWYPELRPYADAALAGQLAPSEHEFTIGHGNVRSVLVQRIPDIAADGRPQGYFAVATDVTEIRRAEAARLDAERRLRDALVAEVHHRVKNSLQGIVGLVRAQADSRPEVGQALEPAISQLLAVAVSFGLMGNRGAQGLPMCEMVRAICMNVAQVTNAQVDVSLDEAVRREPVVIDGAHGVNLSLIVNELVFNAVKHSVGVAAGPGVSVMLQRSDGTATIVVRNPSVGLPPGFDFDAGVGLGTGLRLARLLLPRNGSRMTFVASESEVAATLSLQLPELTPGRAAASTPGIAGSSPLNQGPGPVA